jgi:flagellar M-ring protein FliF
VRSLGAARLLVLGATALGLFGLFAFLLLRVAEPSYTLLYGELELNDSATIVGRLEALGVAFRLEGDGRAILVPADQALRLRMTLAEEGLPRGGSVGDEIFDQQSALGTTEFLANVNLTALSRASSRAPSPRWPTCAQPASIWCCPGASCSAASRSSRARR